MEPLVAGAKLYSDKYIITEALGSSDDGFLYRAQDTYEGQNVEIEELFDPEGCARSSYGKVLIDPEYNSDFNRKAKQFEDRAKRDSSVIETFKANGTTYVVRRVSQPTQTDTDSTSSLLSQQTSTIVNPLAGKINRPHNDGNNDGNDKHKPKKRKQSSAANRLWLWIILGIIGVIALAIIAFIAIDSSHSEAQQEAEVATVQIVEDESPKPKQEKPISAKAKEELPAPAPVDVTPAPKPQPAPRPVDTTNDDRREFTGLLHKLDKMSISSSDIRRMQELLRKHPEFGSAERIQAYADFFNGMRIDPAQYHFFTPDQQKMLQTVFVSKHAAALDYQVSRDFLAALRIYLQNKSYFDSQLSQ